MGPVPPDQPRKTGLALGRDLRVDSVMPDDDLLKEFLVESREGLDKLDQEFLALEQNPTDRGPLGSIFRLIHTIKGNSGFLGLTQVQTVAHAGENLLSKLRDGVFPVTPEIANILLSTVDSLRELFGQLEGTGAEGDTDYSVLVSTLDRLTENGGAAPHQGTAKATAEPAMRPSPLAKPTGNLDDDLELQALIAAANAQTSSIPQAPSAIDQEPQTTFAPPGSTALASKVGERNPGSDRTRAPSNEGPIDTSIRVDVHLLDRLMDLVGELVLTRNQIIVHGSVGDTNLGIMVQRLNGLTSELQEQVMKTRMQPVSTVWNKIPRVVRDISRQVGKQARVDMQGAGTELDRSVLEAMKDPLTHIIRNSLDHGLESPAERRTANKPEEGVIRLTAGHEGGQVVMTFSDDGRGIDPGKIGAKVLEKGLIDAPHLAKMTDQEKIELVFLPGFSTAATVSSISGRGVGMDVVKTSIERIGGRVALSSRLGAGTTVTISIPLTLAIIPALVVLCGGERFAIPQISLRELIRLETPEQLATLEMIGDSRFLRLRDHLVPLVELARILDLTANNQGVVTLAVLRIEGTSFAVVVDQVLDSQEVVVKPLAPQLKDIGLYAGATIMGDGQVALILDVGGLGRAGAALDNAARAAATRRIARSTRQTIPLLLFRSPDDGRMAIPLDQVLRIEELAESSIELVGGQEAIQYREDVLPLVRVFRHLPERRTELRNPEAGVAPGRLSVIVHQRPGPDGTIIGLAVGEILDTIDLDPAERKPPSRRGISATAVLNGKITEILDLDTLLVMAWPELTAGARP